MNITTYHYGYGMHNRKQDKVHYFSHFKKRLQSCFVAGVKNSHFDQSSDQTVDETWNMMTQFLFKLV